MTKKFDFEPLRDALGRFARRAGDGISDTQRRNRKKVDDDIDALETTDTRLGADASRTADRATSRDVVDPADRPTGRDAVGPYYDEILDAHDANPDWVAHPDRWEIPPSADITRLRAEYQALVRAGDLPSGHHILGIADGGTNVPSNIRFTGESRIRFDDLDGLDTSFYEQYGSGTTWMNIHQGDGGVFQFGSNPAHTAVTNLQNAVHAWQRRVGLR